MPRLPPYTPELVPIWSPLAYAVTGVDADQARKAVIIQIVRTGMNTEIPNEGHEFYWMSPENAREWRDALTRAIDMLEPPPAKTACESAAKPVNDGQCESG